MVDTLASSDPFALPPAEIVERVLALGNVPDVTVPRLTMWPTIGRVFEVHREEQDFLVAIGRDAEQISVQEVRADRYDQVELPTELIRPASVAVGWVREVFT